MTSLATITNARSGASSAPSLSLFYKKLYMPERTSLAGNCSAGQLTSVGFEQMRRIGERMRRVYVDKLNFLPYMYDKKQILVRSTDFERTIQSAHALMLGLYPPTTRPEGEAGTLDVHVSEATKETMYPPVNCKRWRELMDATRRLPQYVEQDGLLRQMFENYTRNIPGTWEGVYNTAAILHAHGYPLPSPLRAEDIDLYQRESGVAAALLYSGTERTRLSIGRFLGELADELQKAADGKIREKMHLYSGHDSTLAPLLVALGDFDSRHPPLGGNIILELYRQYPTEHYVRALYNGRTLRVEGCGGPMCPLEKFQELARRLTPVDFEAECHNVPHSQKMESPGSLRR